MKKAVMTVARRELELLLDRCEDASVLALEPNVREGLNALRKLTLDTLNSLYGGDDERLAKKAQTAFDRADAFKAHCRVLSSNPLSEATIVIRSRSESEQRCRGSLFDLSRLIGQMKEAAADPDFLEGDILCGGKVIYRLVGSDAKHIVERAPEDLVEYGRRTGRFKLILAGEGL